MVLIYITQVYIKNIVLTYIEYLSPPYNYFLRYNICISELFLVNTGEHDNHWVHANISLNSYIHFC